MSIHRLLMRLFPAFCLGKALNGNVKHFVFDLTCDVTGDLEVKFLNFIWKISSRPFYCRLNFSSTSVGFRDRWGGEIRPPPPPPAEGRVRTRPSRARVKFHFDRHILELIRDRFPFYGAGWCACAYCALRGASAMRQSAGRRHFCSRLSAGVSVAASMAAGAILVVWINI